jgi:hypothetical protein
MIIFVIDSPAFWLRDAPVRVFQLDNAKRLQESGAPPNIMMFVFENALYREIWVDDRLTFRKRLFLRDLLLNYFHMQRCHLRRAAAEHASERRSVSKEVVVELSSEQLLRRDISLLNMLFICRGQARRCRVVASLIEPWRFGLRRRRCLGLTTGCQCHRLTGSPRGS